jgi:hypothetical protein
MAMIRFVNKRVFILGMAFKNNSQLIIVLIMYKESNLYFEKQGNFNSLCGKCAINNLLGKEEVTKSMLDDICTRFKKEVKQSYKHIFGGDYDLNVLMEALSIFGKECKWISANQLESR